LTKHYPSQRSFSKKKKAGKENHNGAGGIIIELKALPRDTLKKESPVKLTNMGSNIGLSEPAPRPAQLWKKETSQRKLIWSRMKRDWI